MKDYTHYSYDETVQKMTELLKNAEGWGDGYQSSVGQTLIQLMADVTDNLHYMLERRTAESYMDTARLRTSVVARASELGYRIGRAKPNNGFVQFSLKPEEDDGVEVPVFAESDITIEKFKEIVVGDSKFYTVEEGIIEAGENSTVVRVVQGELKTETFEIGEEGSILFPEYEFVADQYLFVKSGGEEYLDVKNDPDDVNLRSLQFVGKDAAYYDIKFSVDGMRIVFGDNTFGKRPSAPVEVTYILVSEDDEPILPLGFEFEITEDILDLDGNEYEWIVENVSPIRGFREPESNSDIIKNSAAYHISNGRAVTNSDYEFWVNKSNAADIVDSRAFGEEEFESLIYNLNNVYITYLKEDGTDLTLEEHKDLRTFMNKIKTSEAHLVFRNANKLLLQVLLDFKKHPRTPIADAEAYDIVKRFLDGYFRLRDGSIGREVQSSDLIRSLYDVKVNRNGIEYPVIDFAKVNLNGIVPFHYPMKTNKVFVGIAPDYQTVAGDEFVLILENLVCKIDVEEFDTNTEILVKMRDTIIQVTPFDARVVLGGVAYDAFGNPLPLEIDPTIGQLMLIGVDTPYHSNDQLLENAVIGSTLARAAIIADAIQVQHFYYSSRKGRRPMIPLRIGTEVSFTAPLDTEVEVYTRMNKNDPTTEVLIQTLAAGESFYGQFTEEHVLQFSYVNDSYEDRIADINYPSFDGSAFGLEISSKDNFGVFDVVTTSGDLTDYITVDYSVNLPVGVSTDSTKNLIRPKSVSIAYPDGVPYMVDSGDGRFIDSISGETVVSGRIDYINGEVTLPNVVEDGDYILIYDQDEFNNFKVDDSTVIQLIQPKPSLSSQEHSLSRIGLANGD